MKKDEVSIIIPIYNEEEDIDNSITTLIKALKQYKYQIIISNDGSTDKSLEKVRKYSSKNITILTSKQNHGRGYAIKKAVPHVKYKKTVFMDADMPLSIAPNAIVKIIKKLDSCKVVKPSRFIKTSESKRIPHRKLLGDAYRVLFRLLFPSCKITDTQVGLKGFNTNTLKKLNKEITHHRWGWDIEVMLLCHKKNIPVLEIPFKWTEFGNSTLNPFTDSFKILFYLIKLRLKY